MRSLPGGVDGHHRQPVAAEGDGAGAARRRAGAARAAAPAAPAPAARRMTSSATIVMTPTISVAVSAVTSRRSRRRRGGSGNSSSPGCLRPCPSLSESFASRWGPRPASALIRRLAAAVPEALALSRSRLQALIARGRGRRRPTAPRSTTRGGGWRRGPRWWCACRRRGRSALRRGDPARHRLRGRRSHRDRQAGRAGGASGAGRAGRHAGERAAAPLRRHAVGDRRPAPARDRAPDRQGHLGAPGGGEVGRGAPRAWRAQFAAHDLERRYLAVLRGAPDPADPRLAHLAGISWEPGGVLRIEGRIGRHPGDRKRMTVLSADRQAGGDAGAGAGALRARRRAGGVAGRMPAGDRAHPPDPGAPGLRRASAGRRRGLRPPARRRGCSAAFPRQALHAASLGFVHPVSGAALRFESPLPADMPALLDGLAATVTKAAMSNEV